LRRRRAAPADRFDCRGPAGADPVKVGLCYASIDNVDGGTPTPVLDPAKIAGKIVVCDRGVTARQQEPRGAGRRAASA
jgi:hypothetical protein